MKTKIVLERKVQSVVELNDMAIEAFESIKCENDFITCIIPDKTYPKASKIVKKLLENLEVNYTVVKGMFVISGYVTYDLHNTFTSWRFPLTVQKESFSKVLESAQNSFANMF